MLQITDFFFGFYPDEGAFFFHLTNTWIAQSIEYTEENNNIGLEDGGENVRFIKDDIMSQINRHV